MGADLLDIVLSPAISSARQRADGSFPD